jgi:hypothetical protein
LLKAKKLFAELKQPIVKLIMTEVGSGVAAKKDIGVGTRIGAYGSTRIVTQHNLGTKWGQRMAGITRTSYLMEMKGPDGESLWFDGGEKEEAKVGRLAAFINDPRGRFDRDGSALEANAMFYEDPTDGMPTAYCIKPIKKGDEVLVSYGWDDDVWDTILASEKETDE